MSEYTIFFATEFSNLILLVFIPLLIFEAWRKSELGQIKKESVPIGFFAIIGVMATIFLKSSQRYLLHYYLYKLSINCPKKNEDGFTVFGIILDS
nr:hypothetical membrane protein [uncultured archaeon]